MSTLTPVAYDPFATSPAPKASAKAGPTLTPVSYDPFATAAMPRGKFGSQIEREAQRLDPGIGVSGRGRTAARNAAIGGATGSAHIGNNARDFTPRKGETSQQAYGRLNKTFSDNGYQVLLEHPGGKHSTGEHIHVSARSGSKEFGPTLTPVDYDPFAPAAKAATPKTTARRAPTLTPVNYDPFASKPGAAKPKPQPESMLYRAGNNVLNTIENAPSDTWMQIKGMANAVRHPIDTVDALAGTVAGGLHAAGVPKLQKGPEAERVYAQDDARFRAAAKPFTSWNNFGTEVVNHPVGMALTLLPAAGVAGKIAGLGVDASIASRIPLVSEAASAAKEGGAALRRGVKKYTDPGNLSPATKRAASRITTAVSNVDLKGKQLGARIEKTRAAFKRATPEEMLDFARVIEGTKPKSVLPAHLRAALPTYTSVLAKAGKDLNSGVGTPLREGYYPHDPVFHDKGVEAETAEAREAELRETLPEKLPGVSKVGSGRQTKTRTHETIDELLANPVVAGLRHNNPADAVQNYLRDVYQRIGHAASLKTLQRGEGAKWETRPSPGRVELKGPGTTKRAFQPTKEVEGLNVVSGQTVQPKVLTAPEDVARLHNNRIATSAFKQNPVVKVLSGVSNLARKGTLGLGGAAHTVQTSISAVGEQAAGGANKALVGAGEMLEGGVREGAAKVGRGVLQAVTSPYAPIGVVRRGAALQKELLAGKPGTEAGKLAVDAGMRVKAPASYENALGRPNTYQSLQRGSLIRDTADNFRLIGNERGGRAWANARGVARTAGAAMDAANHFTFKYQVPALKSGLTEQKINDWLKLNPAAAPAEKLAASRQIVRQVDNVYGEVINDNNFWAPYYNEVSRMLLLSPSWAQGNIRLYLDSTKDVAASVRSVARGQGVKGDLQTAIGVMAGQMMVNGLTTYFMTGNMPEGMDFYRASTGGTTAQGTPERARVLSPMNQLEDVINGKNPEDVAFGSGNPVPVAVLRVLQNQDWRNDPVVPGQYADVRMKERAGAVAGAAAQPFMPIGSTGRAPNPKSKLPAWLAFAGISPAGKEYTDPEGYADDLRNRQTDAWQRKKDDAQ